VLNRPRGCGFARAIFVAGSRAISPPSQLVRSHHGAERIERGGHPEVRDRGTWEPRAPVAAATRPFTDKGQVRARISPSPGTVWPVSPRTGLTPAGSSRSSGRPSGPMRAAVTRLRGTYGGSWTVHLRRAPISLLGHLGARFSERTSDHLDRALGR